MDCAVVMACIAALWTVAPDTTLLSTPIATAEHPSGLEAVPSLQADTVVLAFTTAYRNGPVVHVNAIGLWTVDTVPRRRAVLLSEGYFQRLTIHRYGSYVMLPLFATQYILGRKLLAQKDGVYDGTRRVPIDASLRSAHRTAAYGVATLFAVNTTTGLWNLWEARHDDSNSKRRNVHVLSMLGADAGFVATGLLARRAVDKRPADARTHRNVAIASVGLATFGATLMWF